MLLQCSQIFEGLTPAHFIVVWGLISTSILIWNTIKRSIVFGKVISKVTSIGGKFEYPDKQKQLVTISGQLYMLKLSLSCVRKSLHYQDVNIFVTYGNEVIKGEVYYLKYFNFNNTDGRYANKRLKTPATDFLTFNNVLEEGKTTFLYLNFIVPNKTDDITYDKLEIEFIKPNKNTLKVNITEIEQKQFFIDDDLLEEQPK